MVRYKGCGIRNRQNTRSTPFGGHHSCGFRSGKFRARCGCRMRKRIFACGLRSAEIIPFFLRGAPITVFVSRRHPPIRRPGFDIGEPIFSRLTLMVVRVRHAFDEPKLNRASQGPRIGTVVLVSECLADLVDRDRDCPVVIAVEARIDDEDDVTPARAKLDPRRARQEPAWKDDQASPVVTSLRGLMARSIPHVGDARI